MAFDWKSAATGGVVAMAVVPALALGLDTYKPLPSETPVIYGFLHPKGERAGWYYTTFACVREGNSLDGYVDDRGEAVLPINPFAFVDPSQMEVTTLSRARRLVHDAPAYRSADPRCVEANGFMHSKRSLLMALFD